MFICHLVSWPFVDIHGKFYGATQRNPSVGGGIKRKRVAKYSDFGPVEGHFGNGSLVGSRIVGFRLVTKSVTLNDLERRNGLYFALFHRIRVRCRKKSSRSLSHPLMSFLLQQSQQIVMTVAT